METQTETRCSRVEYSRPINPLPIAAGVVLWLATVLSTPLIYRNDFRTRNQLEREPIVQEYTELNATYNHLNPLSLSHHDLFKEFPFMAESVNARKESISDSLRHVETTPIILRYQSAQSRVDTDSAISYSMGVLFPIAGFFISAYLRKKREQRKK